MTRSSRRATRPGFDDLEGRQLLSVTLPETSPSAPAIATFNGDRYIAWRGAVILYSANSGTSPNV
jgi:hypothetical protein